MWDPLGSAPKVFLAPCKGNRLDAYGTCCICMNAVGFSHLLKFSDQLKDFYVMSSYKLTKLDEKGPAVKDCILAKP